MDDLRKKIEDKKAKIGILGLGYVGLPLAMEFVNSGFSVTGFEKDGRKISSLKKGSSYVVDIPDEAILRMNKSGRFTATADFPVLKQMDVVIICVPTPLRKSKDPDMSFILSAAEEIACNFRKGQLIVLESTTYPGTTREVILPAITAKNKNYKPGRDFFVAFSPERVDPANPKFNTKNTPKVIGGITENCTEMAAALYSKAIDIIVPVKTAEAAEMVKLLENTFRAVNIGLINEIALMCEKLKVDVWEVVDAAKTKPYGFMPFYPGPGIGGHCIPLDPYYLSWKMKTLNFYSRFIELAGEINSKMPEYVVGRIGEILNDRGICLKGAKVFLLGVAYKKNVSDYRESPALDVIELLSHKGAKIMYHDPFVPVLEEGALKLKSSPLAAVRQSDIVVLLTDHTDIDYKKVLRDSKQIYDTRNCLAGNTSKKIVTL